MGVVYKARDPFIGRLVALKTITTRLADKPELLERFYQEARSAGTLQHHNIVTIYELGKEGGTPFIAMEFLEGESLDNKITRGQTFSLPLTLSYIVRVCEALEYAHKRGVVHRDVKPGNVMITTDGVVKVVDFGIARLVDTSRTQTGMVIGTLAYMSPQLFESERADARSDIWAVGVLFYELLCLQRPFSGDSQASLIMSIISKEPRPMRELVPDCPAEVEAVVLRMLRKKVSERFQSMEEVLLELNPLWRRLQQEAVSGLVADSRELIQAQDLQRAQDLLRKALEIDTTNTQAKTLLEKVSAEIKRIQIMPQVKGRVEKGQRLLQEGQLAEAKAEAEAALRLDTTFEPARELLRQVQAAVDRAQALEGKLRRAKRRVAEGALTEAEQQLEELLELDASNAQAKELRKQIREERARQEKRKRLAEVLQRAERLRRELGELRGLVNEGKYQETVGRGEQLLGEFPQEFELVELVRYARGELAQQAHKGRLEERQKRILELLEKGWIEEALGATEKALLEFPGDAELRSLASNAKTQLEEKEKQELLKRRIAEIQRQIDREELTDAIDLAWQTLMNLGPDTHVTGLLHVAEMEYAQREKKAEQEFQSARTLVEAGELEDAAQLLNHAVETRIFSPTDPRLEQIFREIEEKKTSVGGLPHKPHTPRAVTPAADLGKDYVYQRGAPPAKAVAAGGALSATSATRPSSVQPPPSPSPRSAPTRSRTTKREEPSTERFPSTSVAPAPPMQSTPVEPICPPPLFEDPRADTEERPAIRAPRRLRRIALALAALVLAVPVGWWLYLNWNQLQERLLPRTNDDSSHPTSRESDPGQGSHVKGHTGSPEKNGTSASSGHEKKGSVAPTPQRQDALPKEKPDNPVTDDYYARPELEKMEKSKNRSQPTYEERLFQEGIDLERGGQLSQLLFARQKFQEVVEMNGVLAVEAKNHVAAIEEQIRGGEKLKQKISHVEDLIEGGWYGEARAQLKGIDPQTPEFNRLRAAIDNGEQQLFERLVEQFEKAQKSDDKNDLDQVTDGFRVISQSGGPLAEKAEKYATASRELAALNRKKTTTKW